MTFARLLDLIEQARRSSHARQILHDVLLERYGAAYEAIVESAAYSAREERVSQVVYLRPANLTAFENGHRRYDKTKWFLLSKHPDRPRSRTARRGAAMTLEQILDLIEQARRSPHARRVLHDALLERYGGAYEEAVTGAIEAAQREHEAKAVIVRPDRLVVLDPVRSKWQLLGDAIEIHSVADIRAYRQLWRHRQTLPDEVTIVVVRPKTTAKSG